MTLSRMFPKEFYDALLLDKFRELHSRIDLLDWQERKIGEIQGKIVDGSLNVDGNSAIRRTCSLSMYVDDTDYNLTSLNNQIALNKKVKIYVGITNNTREYQSFGSIVWFPLGVYVLTDCSINHGIASNIINLGAQDKMCLLSGEVAGQFQAPTELHREQVWDVATQAYVFHDLKIYDIIRNVVTKIGGEDPAKIIINNVPLEIKTPLKYMGSEKKYFDANNNEITDAANESDPRVARVLNPGDYAGYKFVDFTFPTELIKNPGDAVVSVLDDIRSVLGNYEYYYDVDGNFIFQEVKNYMNTSFTPLTQLSNGHYVADFAKAPYIYSFKEKDIIQSINNTPDWKNIKNDFVVWGMRQSGTEQGAPLMFHLAIDNKPFLPGGYTKPWQQFLVELGDANPNDPGVYYQELKGKLPQCYNVATNQWNADPANYTYFFDLIDAKSQLGKFSVSSIGRRTKSVVDDKVTVMYPPEIPDIIIIPVGTPMEYINHLNAIGQRFQIVYTQDYNTLYVPSGVGKDAFTVIRQLLFEHTSFGEVISITCVPMYFLEVNNRVEVEDSRSNVYGEYILKSMSIPLSAEGLMNINAIRVSSRV